MPGRLIAVPARRRRLALSALVGLSVIALLPAIAAGSPSTNSGYATVGFERIDGDHVLFFVDEEEQGDGSLNGDGDTDDWVVHVWDRSAGTVANLGLAVRQSYLAFDQDVAFDGGIAAFVVSEVDQGAGSLNPAADADTIDGVVHVWEASGDVTNLGAAVRSGAGADLVVSGGAVMFNVSEAAQGGTDLNTDTLVNGESVHAWRSATGITNLEHGSESGSNADPQADGSHFIYRGREHVGDDDNNDGRTNGTSDLLYLWDASDGSVTSVGLAVGPLGGFAIGGGWIALNVTEVYQVGLPNNDSDNFDAIPHVYEIATGTATSSGIGTAPGARVLALGDGSFLFAMDESSQGPGLDHNGDGDLQDLVAFAWPADGLAPVNLELAMVSTASRVAAGDGVVVFGVPEDLQGDGSLNGDGDTDDVVIHGWTTAAGLKNLGLVHASDTPPAVGSGIVGLLVSESEQGTVSLNEAVDADVSDLVVHVWDSASDAVVNLGLASIMPTTGDPDLVLDDGALAFLVDEAAHGATDLNGNGGEAPDDAVIHVRELDGPIVVHPDVGVTKGLAYRDQTLAFRIGEGLIAGDLNGDEDSEDSVLFGIDTSATPPVADAGGPYTVIEGGTVLLDGTGSSDADGSITSYLWEPADRLDDSTLAQPTYTGLDDILDTLTLTVADDAGTGDQAHAEVTVTNAAPVVDAGPDQFITIGEPVSLAPATFTDAGEADTHAATIDWGDGTIEPGVVTQEVGSGSVAGSHVYATTGLFTVTITVTDDDHDPGVVDGDGTDTLLVLVDPPIPANKSLASDGAGGDRFGWSVAMDGDRAVVGMPFDRRPFPAVGAAYVLTWDGVDGWHEQMLGAEDASSGAYFGHSVAVDGDRVVVGAYLANSPSTNASGAVYVYQSDGQGGWLESKLTADQPGFVAAYGYSVAASDDLIVVGAPAAEVGGIRSGAAYVYESDGQGSWIETILAPDDGMLDDLFGSSVAVSGSRVVVGAHRADPQGMSSGSAYVFERNNLGDWSEASLIATDGADGDIFGYAVAVEGDRIVVGAPGRDELGSGSGTVYIFDAGGPTGWVESKLPTPGSAEGLGVSVAARNDRVVVGASEAMYSFESDLLGGWIVTPFTATDGAASDQFGVAVATSNDRALVGAPYDDNIRGIDAGSAYILDLLTTHVPPTVDAGPDDSAVEGSPATLTGSVDDPDDPNPTIEWTADAGPEADAGAVCTFDDDASPTTDVTCTDDGTWTLTLTADDGTNPPVADTMTLTVTNAAPVVQILEPADASFSLVGVNVDVTAQATDPGANDTITECEIDWGDGTVEPGLVAGTECIGSHAFAASDEVTVAVTMTDDDHVEGGVDGEGSATALVTIVDAAPLGQLLATDGGSGDTLGWSVAIDGDRIVTGAIADQDNGVFAGTAYVFDPDGNGGWNDTKLLALDGEAFDTFGWSVAVSGEMVVIGVPFEKEAGVEYGAVYVFEEISPGMWTEVRLTEAARSQGALFGYSVAIDGDRIVVGATGGAEGSGAAFVYTPDGLGGWTEAPLIASDTGPEDGFGYAVAIRGDMIVVGADRGDGVIAGAGAAYVFEPDGLGGWQETDKLVAADGKDGDRFGTSVAIAEGRVVVGADLADGAETDTGAAYLFEPDGLSGWEEVGKLASSDGSASDGFGWSVSAIDDQVAVGAWGTDGIGAAYVYTATGAGTWSEAVVPAPEAEADAWFGWAVAISAEHLVVGAPYDDNIRGINAGAVFISVPVPPNTPPTVEAGADDAVEEGSAIALTGSVDDPDDPNPTIEWTAEAGPEVDAGAVCTFDDATSPTTDVACTDDGTWTLTLTADDGTNPPVADTMTLTVTNAAPVVDAGPDQFITIGETVSLAQATFTDAGTNDTHEAQVTWRVGVSEPAIVTQGAGSGSIAASHVYASTGQYVVTVAVWDDDGEVGIDSFAVLVDPPIPANKILASDGSTEDNLGRSVDIDGDRLVVGAERGDGAVTDSGAAYVYEADGSGGWTEVAKLEALDGAADDSFGHAVAVSGDRIVVGAPTTDGNGIGAGSAYVFEREPGGTWLEIDELIPSGAGNGESLGSAVAIDGDRIIVASVHGAFVFERLASGAWLEVIELTPADGPSAGFGASVAIDGDLIVVGATGDDDLGAQSGSAYVFERIFNVWTEVDKITAEFDGAAFDAFGSGVAIAGDRIAVGAMLGEHPQNGMPADTGAVYTFARNTLGVWGQSDKIGASDGQTFDTFGTSVAMDGQRILVGSGGAGAAYSYVPATAGPTAWIEEILVGEDTQPFYPYDYLGFAIAVSGDRAAVGAFADSNIHGLGAGSAYVFDLDPIDLSPVVDAGDDASGAEGASVTLGGLVVDDGSPTIAWTAPAGAPCTFDDAASPTTDVTCTDDGTWTLTLTADDGANPLVADTMELSVTNALPIVDAGADQAVLIGVSVVLEPATLIDEGSSDTHTASIDWGDGTVEAGAVTQGAGSGSVAGTHLYAVPGSYIVTVTVTDDDGGHGQDSFEATVGTLPPPETNGASTAATASGAVLSIAPPAAAQLGDVLVASIDVRGTATITAPLGWTLIREDTSASTLRKATYWRQVGPSDPASHDWTFSATTAATGIIVAYSGVDGTAPIDAQSGQSGSNSRQSVAPSLTTTVDGTMLVGFFGVANTTTILPPTGMTELTQVQQNVNPRLTAQAADELRPSAGLTGQRIATYGSNSRSVAHLIALRPGLPAAADMEDPSAPTDLVAAASSGAQVELTWTASTDNVAVTRYDVRRAVVVAGTAGPFDDIGFTTDPSYIDATVEGQTTYRYEVVARDAAGNASDPSEPADVATPVAIVLRGVSTAATASGAGLSIAPPAGAQLGDVLVASIDVRGTATITAPLGWTPIREDTSASALRKATYWHQVGPSDPASHDWTFSATTAATGIIVAYSGVDGTAPIDAHSGQGNGFGRQAIAPSLATGVDGAMLVGFFGVSNGTTITSPTGMTELDEIRQNVNPRLTAEAAEELRPVAGPTGQRIASYSPNSRSVAHLIALRPGLPAP